MPRYLKLFHCGNLCGYYKQDGWNEKAICKHPAFDSYKCKTMYIKSLKRDGFPSWCPLYTAED
jgi:hypothetical protein